MTRYSANTIYDYARGPGWILSTYGDRERIEGGHRIEIVLYYTEGGVETHEVSNVNGRSGVSRFFDQYLDIGAQLGSYEGSKPDARTRFSGQPQPVRMQRHAPDIYSRLGHVEGMSETIAVKAAETFGSKWSTKTDTDEWQRIQGVGSKRAWLFADALVDG